MGANLGQEYARYEQEYKERKCIQGKARVQGKKIYLLACVGMLKLKDNPL